MRRRRSRRWILASLGAFVAFTLVFPFAYALLVPEERADAESVALPPVPDGAYHVYVADWGYHTAIVVQQPPGFSLGPPGEERAPYVEYAWGDRRFYMESQYWPWSLFATLVLPTASVLYVDGRADPRALAGARGVYERVVDARALQTLLVELERSARRVAGGTRAAPFAATPEYAGRFHPAMGAYLWTRNCNWWTVERLRAAGLATRSTGVVFSGQVAGHLVGFAHLASPPQR